MLLVATNYITGMDPEMPGPVRGNTIQTKNIGRRNITQGFKTLAGGKLSLSDGSTRFSLPPRPLS